MALAILDIVPEHPQKPHVADQVQPAAVQEHRGERGEPVPLHAQYADLTWAERQRSARRHAAEKLAGNKPQLADGARQRRIHTATLTAMINSVTTGVPRVGLSSR